MRKLYTDLSTYTMKRTFYAVTISSVCSFTNLFNSGFRTEIRADTISLKASIQTCLLDKGKRKSEEVNEMSGLLRWFLDLAREMDRGMSTMRGGQPEKMLRRNARPEAKVVELGHGVVAVRVYLNGVAPEDLDLTFSNRGVIIISGIMRHESADEKAYNLEDLENFETFREVVELPAGYANADTRAKLADGVLEISLEKSEANEELRQLRIEKN
jgi:HSP20 family molecular chaperone IbpA